VEKRKKVGERRDRMRRSFPCKKGSGTSEEKGGFVEGGIKRKLKAKGVGQLPLGRQRMIPSVKGKKGRRLYPLTMKTNHFRRSRGRISLTMGDRRSRRGASGGSTRKMGKKRREVGSGRGGEKRVRRRDIENPIHNEKGENRQRENALAIKRGARCWQTGTED